MRVLLGIILVVGVTAGVACSSSSSSAARDGAPDSAATSDSGAADTAPLSADCQRLYNCCVGPAAQTPSFCTGLVGQNICSVWLQSYAMAGIQCQ